MKDFIKKYKHGIPIIVYMIVYLIIFFVIERVEVDNYTIIHLPIDDKIPFIEYFIVPYTMWFMYVAVFVAVMVFFDKDEYTRLFTTLVTGMTLFLIVSTLWPNMHELRAQADLSGNSIFVQMIRDLYETDTPTNLIPSIHVYNSIMIHVAVMHSSFMKKHKVITWISGILCTLIVLSTMFIKQHSIIDVIVAIVLAVVMYLAVYVGKLNFFKFRRK